MNNLLSNNTGLNTNMGVIGGYNQPQQNIQQSLIDNIINQSKIFIDGKALMELNNTLLTVLKKYELVISDDGDKNIDYKIVNEELINKFLDAKRIQGLSPRTLEYYELEDTRFLDFICKSILDVKTQDIREYLNFNQTLKNCSNRTLDNKRRVLNTTFQWFCDEGFIMSNPLVGINKIRHEKKLELPFSPDEIEKMREEINKISTGKYRNSKYHRRLKLRDIAIFELLLSSGIRVNELVNLNRGTINFNNNSFLVLGKGNKQREAYFNSKAKLALERYLDSREDNEICLFYSKSPLNNHRMTVNGVERLIRNIGDKVGVKAYPHKFRKTFATNLLRKGVPLEQLKVLLGHANIDTTSIYALTDNNEVEMNHRRLIN